MEQSTLEVERVGGVKLAPAWWGVAVGSLVFVCIAPTLAWFEFANGSEILNVTTAMEIRRTGNWLMPTLQGEPRIQKPPLTAWITAASVRESTLRLMSSADAGERAAGERQLGWDARWAALLAACGMVAAAGMLGTIIGGPTLGVTSAVVCGTTLLFLRFARLATTDIHLALWVNVANVFLALAVLRGRWWVGCVLGGAALGLAFMSKGPVALVQSVAAVAAFIAWERWGAREDRAHVETKVVRRGGFGRVALPAIVGTIVMLAIAIPWFAYVLRKTANDNLGNVWLSEVSRVGATDLEPDPWFNYVSVIPFFFPWVVYLISGLVVGGQHLWRRVREPRLLALFMFLVPILVMSFFKDRKERYLLPMLGPGAVVTGWALVVLARAWRDLKKDERWAVGIHWGIIGVAGVALPVLAATGWLKGLRRADGGPWFGWGLAVVAAAVMLAIVVLSARWQRRDGFAPIVGTFVFMLLFQLVLTAGYRTSDEAQSQLKPLAEAVWERAPGVQAYNAMRRKRVPGDLSIYLNQTVREVTRAELRRLERPHVVIMYQDGDDKEPPVPPEDSELIAKVPRGRHWWYAYLRE